VDKKLTNDRRSSISNPTPTNISGNIPNNTGALIFGHRFSLSNITFPNINFFSQEQNDFSFDPNRK